MKPLEVRREPLQEEYCDGEDSEEKVSKNKPLLQRMAEDKRNQMEKGSLAGKQNHPFIKRKENLSPLLLESNEWEMMINSMNLVLNS